MNATQEMWLVIANGQKVMGREMLTLAQQGRSADEVAECVKLANFCGYIETVARRKAFEDVVPMELFCHRGLASGTSIPQASFAKLACGCEFKPNLYGKFMITHRC